MRARLLAGPLLLSSLISFAARAEDITPTTSKGSLGQNRTVTNSIGMKLMVIPSGEFTMGSRQSGAEAARHFGRWQSIGGPLCDKLLDDEQPAHRVRITKAFLLGSCTVTVDQFRSFVADSGYKTDAEKGTGAHGIDGVTGEESYRAEYSWRNPGFPQTGAHPVVCISWNDAVAFCRWLSRKERTTYRLPTEAEWEYACRAGTTTYYWCGDDAEELAKVANVLDGTAVAKFPGIWGRGIHANDGYVFTSPVGSFQANPFGLYDMHGNAAQWCADWADDRYYRTSPRDDPSGPATGLERAVRGECFIAMPISHRSAHRESAGPDFRTFGSSFRVARTVEPERTKSGGE